MCVSAMSRLLFLLQHYITECVGVGFVGISQIILGIGSGVTSVTVGKMINIVPRSFVVVFGALEDAGFLLFLLLWERVPSLPTIFVVVLLWGIGDGIWNTIPTSMFRDVGWARWGEWI